MIDWKIRTNVSSIFRMKFGIDIFIMHTTGYNLTSLNSKICIPKKGNT